MALPKRRHSHQRKNKRRSHHALKMNSLSNCPQCDEPRTAPPRMQKTADTMVDVRLSKLTTNNFQGNTGSVKPIKKDITVNFQSGTNDRSCRCNGRWTVHPELWCVGPWTI